MNTPEIFCLIYIGNNILKTWWYVVLSDGIDEREAAEFLKHFKAEIFIHSQLSSVIFQRAIPKIYFNTPIMLAKCHNKNEYVWKTDQILFHRPTHARNLCNKISIKFEFSLKSQKGDKKWWIFVNRNLKFSMLPKPIQ